MGQLLSEDGPWDSDTVSYSYNNRFRSGASVLQPNASAWAVSYGYDAARRLTNVTSGGGAFGYQYVTGRQGLVSKLTVPGSSYVTNHYDSVARLLFTKMLNSGASVLDAESYSYNPGNQRTQQVFTAGNYVDYTYDDIGQLKTAKGKESGGTSRALEQMGYAYDAAGNLNWRTNNAFVQTFNVNSLNELTTATRSGTLTVAGTTTSAATNVTVNALTATRYNDATFAREGFPLVDATTNFTAIAQDNCGRSDTNTVSVNLAANVAFVYDLNGNLRTNGTRVFEYDDENQLVRVMEPGAWKSEFAYDGKLRRRVRQEYGWVSSAWVLTNEVRYVYDGNLVIQERDANNLPTVTYTRGKDLSGTMEGAGGIGGLLARTDHAQASLLTHALYHADGNGNIMALVATNGLLLGRYHYDPYGNLITVSGQAAVANLYRFSSKEWHPNSGLVYYLYRFYDAGLQRWVNQDPIGELGGINLYAMVVNNPVSRYDANGLADCSDPCGEAKKAGLDKGNPAGTVCCGGKKFACVWDPGGDTNPRDSTAKKIIKSCLEAHENEHVKDPAVTCKSACLSMASSNREAECRALKAELGCLRSAIRACAGNPQCINQVKDAMGTTKMGINDNCGK